MNTFSDATFDNPTFDTQYQKHEITNSGKWFQRSSKWLKRIFYAIVGLYVFGSVIMATMIYVHRSNRSVYQTVGTTIDFSSIKNTAQGMEFLRNAPRDTTVTFKHPDMCPVDKYPVDVPVSQPNCSLACGSCGGCAINTRTNQEVCACSKYYATFPLYCDGNSRTCDNVNINGVITAVCSCKHEGTISYFYPCGYQLQDRVGAFLASFFGGSVGADWFLFYRGGNGGYIVAGIFKLLTFGGVGIWTTVDWIRVVASESAFPDGNNYPLAPWP